MNLFTNKLFIFSLLAAGALHLFGKEANSIRSSYKERLQFALDESQYDGDASDRNRRIFTVAFSLHAAVEDRQDPYQLLDDALDELKLDPDYQEILRKNLVECYLTGEHLGLCTSGNFSRISRNELPIITLGGFNGDTAECVPIISSDLAPEAEILIANLMVAPTPLVSDDGAPPSDSYHCASELHEADMISYASYRRVASAFEQ